LHESKVWIDDNLLIRVVLGFQGDVTGKAGSDMTICVVRLYPSAGSGVTNNFSPLTSQIMSRPLNNINSVYRYDNLQTAQKMSFLKLPKIWAVN